MQILKLNETTFLLHSVAWAGARSWQPLLPHSGSGTEVLASHAVVLWTHMVGGWEQMEKVYLLSKSLAPEAHMPPATWPCPAARGQALGKCDAGWTALSISLLQWKRVDSRLAPTGMTSNIFHYNELKHLRGVFCFFVFVFLKQRLKILAISLLLLFLYFFLNFIYFLTEG